MKMLIVGNGFDLAHGLPTKYGDFLKFISGYSDSSYIEGATKFKGNKEQSDNFNEIIQNNKWIEYFTGKHLNEGWIDFETEISSVIQEFNRVHNNNTERGYALYPELEYQTIEEAYNESEKCNIPKFKEELEADLNKLILALEIYLLYVIEKTEINIISPDIIDIQFDKVLSFNYTHTFSKVYENNKVEYNFIHGETKDSSTIETNNMVLGVDDYTEEKLINKDVEFIAFKKYFQRIHKKNEIKYKSWIEQSNICETNIPGISSFQYEQNEAYIFGHSLDVTDKDILEEIIMNEKIITTIFYLDKATYGKQIVNLVEIIGKKNMIQKVSGDNPSIIFKKQQDMKEITE